MLLYDKLTRNLNARFLLKNVGREKNSFHLIFFIDYLIVIHLKRKIFQIEQQDFKYIEEIYESNLEILKVEIIF